MDRSALTLFLHCGDVPADNNRWECDIQPVKVHPKVVKGLRSRLGAEWHSSIMSMMQTASKQQKNILDRQNGFMGMNPSIQVSYRLGSEGTE